MRNFWKIVRFAALCRNYIFLISRVFDKNSVKWTFSGKLQTLAKLVNFYVNLEKAQNSQFTTFGCFLFWDCYFSTTDKFVNLKDHYLELLETAKFHFSYVLNRPAHFSHFSREREMVLRDISREKCGARNCEKKWPKFGQFMAKFDQNAEIFKDKML